MASSPRVRTGLADRGSHVPNMAAALGPCAGDARDSAAHSSASTPRVPEYWKRLAQLTDRSSYIGGIATAPGASTASTPRVPEHWRRLAQMADRTPHAGVPTAPRATDEATTPRLVGGSRVESPARTDAPTGLSITAPAPLPTRLFSASAASPHKDSGQTGGTASQAARLTPQRQRPFASQAECAPGIRIRSRSPSVLRGSSMSIPVTVRDVSPAPTRSSMVIPVTVRSVSPAPTRPAMVTSRHTLSLASLRRAPAPPPSALSWVPTPRRHGAAGEASRTKCTAGPPPCRRVVSPGAPVRHAIHLGAAPTRRVVSPEAREGALLNTSRPL